MDPLGAVIAVAKDVWGFWGLHPILCWGLLGALLVNNAVRVTWRDYATRPTAARLIVAVTDPLCLNFWRLTLWLGDKAGIKVWTPDQPDSVSPAAVADAVKRGAP